MIGQRELLKKIDGQIERDKFPKVSILIGEKGSGRKTLAYHISQKLNRGICFLSSKQEMETSYKITLPLVYVIADCDKRTITDEIIKYINNPPTYIILTYESADNIHPGIKNKAVTYMMGPYSCEEKCDWLHSFEEIITDEDEEYILEVATNIGEVRQMCFMDMDNLRTTVHQMIDSLKTYEDISKYDLNQGGDEIPLSILWKAFMATCADMMKSDADNSLFYCNLIAITGDYLQDLPSVEDTRDHFCDWLNEIETEWNAFNS